MHRDSTRDPLARIVAVVTEPEPVGANDLPEGPERIIDSIPFGFDPALHFSNYCGDCGHYEVVTVHPPWLARIEYSLDDREDYNPALLARIAEVARTFRWRH